MIKITKDNYKSLEHEWYGLVVAIPLIPDYDSDMYLYSKYINHNNEEEYHRVDWNKENSSAFSTCQLVRFNEVFHNFENFKWFHFQSLDEFFTWCVKGMGYKIERPETKVEEEQIYPKVEHKEFEVEDGSTISYDKIVYDKKELLQDLQQDFAYHNKKPMSIDTWNNNQDKEWIHEKCGTNPVPNITPQERPHLNKEEATEEFHEINKEMIYWEIYNDPNTDDKIKTLIEESYPQFKEQFYETLAEETSNNKIEKKVTRRQLLHDVIYYINERDTLDKIRKSVVHANTPWGKDSLNDIFKRKQTKLNKWLDEEV